MSPAPAINAIIRKNLDQRDALWPGMATRLWNRKANKGFATIPKTMPLILQIMDGLSKGKPLSSTYLGLWCSTWDNSFVTVSRPQELAHAAGFSGARAEYTWAARMKLLESLSFINVKPGAFGPISYVLILNPHIIIREHYANRTQGLTESAYNALLARALEIGALDMVQSLDAPADQETV